MCEVCEAVGVKELERERLVSNEEWYCDHVPDPEDPEASGEDVMPHLASWRVRQRYAEDHHCDAHMRELQRHRGEGPGEILRATGLQVGGEFVRIRGAEPCGEVVGPGPLRGQPARWVEVVETDLYLCDEHLDET